MLVKEKLPIGGTFRKILSSGAVSDCKSCGQKVPLPDFKPTPSPQRVCQFAPLKDRLWTPSEAAEYLGVSKKTIHELCRRKELEYIVVSPRGDRRFTEAMLDEFIGRNTVQKPVDRKAGRSTITGEVRQRG